MRKVENMKKVLYIILLLAELAFGALLMSAAWNSIGWLPCVITIVLWAVLLVWQIVVLKKNTDEAKARKIKRNIALIMLIPSLSYVATVLWLIIVLFAAF